MGRFLVYVYMKIHSHTVPSLIQLKTPMRKTSCALNQKFPGSLDAYIGHTSLAPLNVSLYKLGHRLT